MQTRSNSLHHLCSEQLRNDVAGTPKGKDMCGLKTKCSAQSFCQEVLDLQIPSSPCITKGLSLSGHGRRLQVYSLEMLRQRCGLPHQLPVMVEAGYHVGNRIIKLKTVRFQVPFQCPGPVARLMFLGKIEHSLFSGKNDQARRKNP